MFTEGKGRNLVVFLALLTGLSCGEGDDGTGICETGRSLACVGQDGCEGYQVCDGFEWGPCLCGEDGGTDDGEDLASDAGDDSIEADNSRADDSRSDDAEAEAEAEAEVPECRPSDCYDGNPCATAECLDGECVNTLFPDGTPCLVLNGRCYDGSCCLGCWTGSTCLDYATASTSPTTCGLDGRTCVSCDDGDECTENRCYVGRCDFSFHVPDGTPCSGGACRLGVCSS